METITGMPFRLDADALAARLRIEPGSDDARDFVGLCELAAREGRPKAVYAEAFVESRSGSRVRIGGVEFESRMLSLNLAEVGRVFPHVATCGRELDEVFADAGDPVKAFWWDAVKAAVLGAAKQALGERLHRRYRLGRTATMHPGSGDAGVWPIEQQQALFALLGDVRGAIGVDLTPSFLMVPNKTVSGLLFPAEKDFRSCEVCHREGCPSRHAAFNAALWEQLRHD